MWAAQRAWASSQPWKEASGAKWGNGWGNCRSTAADGIPTVEPAEEPPRNPESSAPPLARDEQEWSWTGIWSGGGEGGRRDEPAYIYPWPWSK